LRKSFLYSIGLFIALYTCVSTPAYAPDLYWNKWIIDDRGNGADGVHIGDINQDGMVDVVSGWEQSGNLVLYLNPGPTQVRQTNSWPHIDVSGGLEIEGIEDAAFADLNLDGREDAVISSIEGDTRTLSIHWPVKADITDPDNWQASNLAPDEHAGYMKARAAQIDGWHGADIVAGAREAGDEDADIYWFQAPPGSHPDNIAQWQRFHVGKVAIKTVTLLIRDMDSDQLPDIVVSGRKGIAWFRNPGHQALQQAPAQASWERIVISTEGSEFTFCDHEADGVQDIIATSSQRSGIVARWLKRLDASGRNWADYPITSDSLRGEHASNRKFVLKGVACGFVNDDDRIDVVFTGSGHGHGVFMMSPRSDIASGQVWDLTNLSPYADYIKFDNLRLADVDGDGDLDILTTEEGEGIFSSGDGVLWFENPRIPAESHIAR
jgi:hypothetical protein